MARLIIESGPQKGKVYRLPPSGRFDLGRDPSCAVPLEDALISRHHCRIVADGNKFALKDLSRNGTYLNHERTKDSALQSGDLIRVGETFVSFFEGRRDPLIGKNVAGYRIQRRLGRGAMGIVYRALQLSLHRTVALKILPDELTENAEFIRRFLEEALAAAKLSHAHVVAVLDVGEHQGMYYLAMEYMRGGSLQDLLDREGPQPAARVVGWTVDLARALAWAEGKGIVHRDLKPDNLLLDARGRVKIGDFGLAADFRRSRTLYQGGKVLGTPIYMAPEQALGKPLDHRADLYALGATMYRALAGVSPFTGETPAEVLLKKVQEDPAPLDTHAADAPPVLTSAINRLMAREPDDRFQSADELLDALQPVLGVGVAAPVAARSRSLGRRWMWASGAAALVAVIALVIALAGGDDSPAPPVSPGDAGSTTADDSATTKPAPDDSGDPAGSTPSRGDAAATADATTSPPASTEPAPTPEQIRERAAATTLARIERELELGSRDERQLLAQLEEFAKEYPDEKWRKEAETVRSKLTARLDGQRALRSLLTGTIRRQREEGKLRDAWAALESFAKQHPELERELGKARVAIREEARQTLADATARLATLEKNGELDVVLAEIAKLRERLPAEYDAELTARADAIEAAQAAHTGFETELEAAIALVRSSYRSLEFEPAESALEALIGKDPPAPILATARRTALELRAFRSVLDALQAGVKKAGELVVDKKSGDRVKRQVGEVSGLSVKLVAPRGETEEIELAALDDETLEQLLASGGAASSSGATKSEALGLFLLHAGGPARAWPHLVGNEANGERREERAKELARMLRVDLETRLEPVLERISLLDPNASDRASCTRELEALRRMLLDSQYLSGERELLADLRAAWIDCRARLLRLDAPEGWFAAPANRVRYDPSDGILRVRYDFRDEAQLADFFPVDPNVDSRTSPGRGAMRIRGSVRYLAGNPFRDQLRIAAQVRGPKDLKANLGATFWTRVGERFPDRRSPSRYSPYGPGSEVFAFVFGYYNETGSSVNGIPYIYTENGDEIVLPGNVVWRAARDFRAQNFVQSKCLWGMRPVRARPAVFSYEIATSPDVFLWRFGRTKYSLPSAADVVSEGIHLGSVTLSSGARGADYRELSVEGRLDPFWIEDEVYRRAAAELNSFHQAGKLPRLRAPLEATGRAGFLRSRPGRTLFHDDFNGDLADEWTIVAEDESHHSLTDLKGALTIRTQRGAIVGTRNGFHNLFLVDAPSEDEYQITTRVVGFRPSESYQQAAIVAFAGPDDFLKASFEFSDEARRFVLLRENGRVAHKRSPAIDARTVWLRLRRRGNLYSFLASDDGETFRFIAEIAWDSPPRQIGLIAKNAVTDAKEINARFDLFDVWTPHAASPSDAR